MRLIVLATPPDPLTLSPDAMDPATTGVIVTRAGVELRLALVDTADSPVVVRPWVYRGGSWEPVRADGGGNGPSAVTAELTINGGQANGIFMCGSTAASFCLVLESGDVDNIAKASLDEHYIRS